MMDLYRKNKVNPLGGCLPLLLQIPVFFALYSSLSSAVELRHAPFIFWISDLSQPDGLGITPLLMGVSMYIQQKMTPQTAMMDSTQVKIMQMLPFVFTVFSFTFPSGLTMYWVTSNVLSIAQQQIINRIKTPEMQDWLSESDKSPALNHCSKNLNFNRISVLLCSLQSED